MHEIAKVLDKMPKASSLGSGELIRWLDDGPPKTDSPPAAQETRFYRVISGQ